MVEFFLITSAQVSAGGTVAIAALTLGLLTAAVWAGRRVGRQLQVTQEELEVSRQARADSQRPVIAISDLALDPDGTPGFTFANIGAGPALGIAVSFWLFPRDTPLEPRMNPVDALIESSPTKDWGEPHFLAYPPAMGVGEEPRKWVGRAHRSVSPDWRGEHGTTVAWTIDTVDVLEGRRTLTTGVHVEASNLPPLWSAI